MKKNIAPFYLIFVGLLFAGFGLAYLFYPLLLIEQSGMQTPTAGAKADVWAMYAGLQMGFGLFLLVCAKQSQLQLAGLLCISFIFGGIAIGRTFGVIYYQAFDIFNLSALCLEWPGTLIAIYLYKQHDR